MNHIRKTLDRSRYGGSQTGGDMAGGVGGWWCYVQGPSGQWLRWSDHDTPEAAFREAAIWDDMVRHGREVTVRTRTLAVVWCHVPL